MRKVYRALEEWNSWLTEPAGKDLLALEREYLTRHLSILFGRHALLIGVPKQIDFLSVCDFHYPALMSYLTLKENALSAFQSDLTELPIASGSIDLVIIPHILEYAAQPHRLFNEACRIVKPEGHIAILGFNPRGLWGIRKIFTQSKQSPWGANFLPRERIKKWLRLAEFSLLKQDMLLFRPPLPEKQYFNQLKFLEFVGKKLYKPLGGVYFILAQAKVIPLTPIRLKWKQKLADFEPSVLTGSMS